MSFDAFVQPEEGRRDFRLALGHPDSALGPGQRLVALHPLGGNQTGYAGHQQQLALHQLSTPKCPLVGLAADKFGGEARFDGAGQAGIGNVAEEARLGDSA